MITFHKNTMENPNDFHFPPNQTQHNRGPINAGRNASTLPKSENTMRPIIEFGAKGQLPMRKQRNSVARGAIVKAKAHIPDLNVPLVQYECALCGVPYDRLRAICGHMKKHRNRLWKGLERPSTAVSFNLNEVPKDDDK